MMYYMASASTILQPLKSQVGGHAGISTTENGSLLIKPAVPAELAFYQRLQQDRGLDDLRAFTPKFLGTLKLIGKVDEAGFTVSESIVVESIASEDKDESQFRQVPVVSPYHDAYVSLSFFSFHTIHCIRKSLILFPQTQYYRHQARDGVIR